MTDKEQIINNFEKDINVPSKEQIIIDGVDVSGCLFYQSNFEEDYDVRIKHFCSNWHNCCKSSNNQNCYFKQLKRKEQECEELQEKLKFKDNENSNLNKKYRQEQDERRSYRKAFEEIEECINNLKKQDILTFPDFSLQENYKVIMKQCNEGYRQILDIINKAKDRSNEN